MKHVLVGRYIGFKILSIFLPSFLFVLLLVSGCTSLSNTEMTSSYPENFTLTGSLSNAGNTPIDSFALSQAPKTGETAELTFPVELGFYTNSPNLPDDTNNVEARAWVEFSYANTQGSYSEAEHGIPIPYDEVLVSGQLAWEGNPFDINDTLNLGGTIQLPREGIWNITGYLQAEGLDNTFMEKTFKEEIRVAVTKDTAKIIKIDEDYTGSLAYLRNFPYGQIDVRDPDEQFSPVIFRLDTSKIPGVGEETLLSCRIRSIVDTADYSINIIIDKRLKDNTIHEMPIESILVEGDLAWQGELKKNEPVEFSATIAFPEEGEWQIRTEGRCSSNDKLNFADSIKMNLTSDISYYGWDERTSEPLQDIELPGVSPFSDERISIMRDWDKYGPPKQNYFKYPDITVTAPPPSELNLEEENNENVEQPTQLGSEDAVSFADKHLQLLDNGAIELVEERSEYIRNYQMPDGTKTVLVSSAPIQYKTPNGDYQLINNSLVPTDNILGYAFTNKANSYSVYFPQERSEASMYTNPNANRKRD